MQKANFERAVTTIDAKLAKLVAEHDDGSALSRRLRTVPGVGPVLAQTLTALLPELGKMVACMLNAMVRDAIDWRASAA